MTVHGIDVLHACGYSVEIDNGQVYTNAPQFARKLANSEFTTVPGRLISIPATEAIKDEFFASLLEGLVVDKDLRVVVYNTSKTRNPSLVTLGIDIFDGSTSVGSFTNDEIPYDLYIGLLGGMGFLGSDRILYEEELNIIGKLTGESYDSISQILEGVSILEDAEKYFPFTPAIKGSFRNIISSEEHREQEEEMTFEELESLKEEHDCKIGEDYDEFLEYESVSIPCVDEMDLF